jgi:tetratricopeptide (TPR) repeat protein
MREFRAYLALAACLSLVLPVSYLRTERGLRLTVQQPELDVSGSPEARELFDTGRINMEQGRPRQALDSFEAAIKKDPNFALAWSAAGTVHFGLQDHEQGIEEMKHAVALAPRVRLYYLGLASALMLLKREQDALKVWQQLQQAYPDDADARKNIALILGDLGRYQEELTQLEAAMNDPDGWKLMIELGLTYAELGQKEKAIATLEGALQRDSSADSLNAVAYALAEKNLLLEQALQYAQRAVREREHESSHISLEHLTYDDLRTMPGLGGDWDTLGWTYFKLKQNAAAQKYLEAAWSLFESPTIGDHLGQLYERLGRRDEAAHTYALALAQGNAPDETIGRLTVLLGSRAAADEAVEGVSEKLAQLRSVKVERIARTGGKAEFFVLLARGPRVVDVKFIKGSESLRDAQSAVAAAKFDVLFPDEVPTEIVRRGELACRIESSGCEFELFPPDSVQSVE